MTNRNSNAHFDLAPQVEIERSTFDRSCNIKTSFNVGLLIPFYVDEVLPGDTFQIETSKVARLQTLITPVMDNLFLDTYYFFVPNRLVWEHWQNFCGENDVNAWYYEQPTYSVPQVIYPDAGFDNHTIADYMGVPTKVDFSGESYSGTFGINALPFRAYCKIYNDWFRDENLQPPVYFPTDETEVIGVNGNYNEPEQTAYKGGRPLYANKTHDYFTSCLPSPQKNPDLSLFASMDMAPVRTFSDDLLKLPQNPVMKTVTVMGQQVSGKRNVNVSFGQLGAGANDDNISREYSILPSNLYADLTDLRHNINGQAYPSNMTINTLRQAFQIQRLFEKDARGGTRYIEILKSHYGVTSPDARLQRAEYLGGNRVPLNIEQVVNTTGNETLSLLPGDTSGWSQTNDVSFDVNKSFVEHGFIIGIMCVRYDHSYQQGLERFWSRKSRFDYYWPALAHLGEQAVLKDEICLNKFNVVQDSGVRGVFGYQEAWAEYRYKPNYITGSMRSNENNSLDIWHFADNYANNIAPFLSMSWMREDKNNVDRALAVKSNVENQIFVDVFVKNKCTRPMPLYSIPGLIDHF